MSRRVLAAICAASFLLATPSEALATPPAETQAHQQGDVSATSCGGVGQDWCTPAQSYEQLGPKFYSAPLGRCIRPWIRGVLHYKWKDYDFGSYVVRYYKEFRVEDPFIGISVVNSCDTNDYRNLTKATLVQRWYHWHGSCGWTPRIAVGFPWSVSVSATPDCGNEDVAKRGTTYDQDAHLYRQFNTGLPFHWTETYLRYKSTTDPKPCIKGMFTVIAYRGSTSDGFGFDRKVCTFA